MNTSSTPRHTPQPLGATLQSASDGMAALIEYAGGHGKPHATPGLDGLPYTLLPPGWQCAQLPRKTEPDRARGTVKLRDADSFIKFFNYHKVEESRIYASLQPARFLAVMDDHSSVDSSRGWREFRADFTVPPSREWVLWTGQDRKPMTQLELAEFLQDNLPDVVEPDGAALLEMALRFEASQTGSFVAAQRLQDGSHDLQWKADNNASGTVKLPEHIAISVPVFENTLAVRVQARLRYRLKEGRLAIWYELVRPHKVMEEAFRATWGAVKEACGDVILLGAPE